MKRRILSVLLVLLMLVGMLPVSAFAAETNTYPFTLTANGETVAVTEKGTTTNCALRGAQVTDLSVTLPAGTTSLSVTAADMTAVHISPNDSGELFALPMSPAIIDLTQGYTFLCMMLPQSQSYYHLYIDYEEPASISVTGITLDQESVELEVGGTVTLTATVTPEDATDKTVTWTSSDESIATVADGVVTAVAAGEATITAKAGGKEASCAVTVKEAASSDENLSIAVICGDELCEQVPVGNENFNIAWNGPGYMVTIPEGSDLTIEPNGKIECYDIDWNYYFGITDESLTISAAKLQELVLDSETCAAYFGNYGVEIPENAKMAALSIYGLDAGGTNINLLVAITPTEKEEEPATVAVTGITLDQESVELEAGGTVTLTAAVTPEDATDKTVTWTSSNEAVATVADGVVTAVAAGEATITAKAGEQTATCVVTVKEKDAVPFSQSISVPSNGDSSWGHVSGLTLSGTDGSIYEAYWSSTSTPFVLDVILGQDTDLDATITAAFTVGGMRAPSISGDTSVTLVDGKGTIQVTAKSGISAFYPDTSWTINITVDDGSAANRKTFEVTLPTDTVGYTVAAYNSESPVIEGRSFSFKVTIDGDYKTDETFAVKANGTELTAANGIYTIENISEAQVVTVEGVVEKTTADKGVTVIVPAGSTVSSGRHYSYFKYDFSEPLEETTLEDGRIQKIFPPQSGRQGFIRVQHPDGVTYWDFDGLKAGSVFEITEEMLFIGSTEFTRETVYASFEKNVKDKADLYLTANEKGWLDLNTGDTWNLNVFRNFLSLGNTITNDCLALPDVEYKVVSVDGTPSSGVITVTPNENNNSYAEIKAVGAGTAIILVSYDAVYNCDGEGGQQWSAIWPENTGVIVVTVDATDASIATNMTVNEEANSSGKQVIDAEHDILFYVGSSGAEYSFKPEAGCTVTVNRSSVGSTMTFGSFTSSGVETGADGTVTVKGLTTGAHIIKVEKGGQAVYQVVRARQVSYEVKHSDGSLVTAESPAQPGEKITVQFHGLISPMEKLSGVYNTNFAFYYIDEEGTNVSSSSSSGYGVYVFSGSPSLQKFTATVPSYWNEATYTLTDGAIRIGGFGSNAGAHRTTTYIAGKEVNTNASGVAGILSVLPDIVIDTAACGYDSFDVTLPTGKGYTVTGGAVPVPEGETYTFTVAIAAGYDSANMVVKVNGKEITATDGSYSVENVRQDLTVTIEGVEKLTADMSNAVAVYTNGVDGTEWGRRTSAYVDTVSIGGAQVESYAWDDLTCNVTLSSDTAADASVGFVVTYAGNPASWVAKMSATLDGTAMTAGEPTVIKLVDGKATVQLYAAYNNSSKYGGTKTFVLTVAEKPVVNVESIALDRTSAQLEIGQSLTLTATVTPEDATDKTVIWTSSDEAVATVSGGKVTAVSAGIATITAATADGNKTAECLVGVKKPAEPEFGIPADEIAGYATVSFEDFGVRVEGESIDPAYAEPRGVIIPATKVPFRANDSIAAVTLRLLDAKGVKAVYSGSETSGFYLSSIDGFGEFDAGMGSGWMVTLNDWFINKGASEFTVKDGDAICWRYTCQLGKDIGDDSYYASVTEVEDLIDAIGTVTLNSEAKIEAAREAYDKLTAGEKSRVSNYQDLTAAEKKLAQLKTAEDEKKADAVEDLIDKIISGSTSFEKDVEKAQDAYNDLTAEQKKLVDNYSKLANALKTLASEEDKEAAEEVEKQIDAIGLVTKDSEEEIKAAREAYDKLTDGQKALVGNLAELEAAEEKLTQLKNQHNAEDVYKTTGDYLEALGTPGVGSVGGEWMVIGLIRSGREVEDLDAWYEAVVDHVQENADEDQRLHRAKSTENSRLILALTAAGKDVTDVDGHDLLAGLNSMEYIQKQGINGPIWALIAFDSGNYPVPEGDVSRDALIETILDAQLADGGWALSGTVSDPDITGMALQALAPYYKTNEKVKAAIDEAIEALSELQATDGSYASIDGKSSESIAQVITGLAAVGIDSHTDKRFVKNGVSAVDALCAFYVEGGGFTHVPGGKLDGMATEQGYYALAAYFRMLEGENALYDMTDVIDRGGDPEETVPTETLPAETEPVPTDEGEGGFPWWLVLIIVVQAGVIVVLVLKLKKRR